MKLAFIGAPCSGKTTIVSQLADRHDDVIIIPEAASHVFLEVPNADRSHWMTHLGIMTQTFLFEERMKLLSWIRLCDRSLLDAYVYIHMLDETDKIGKEMKDFIREYMKTYTQIYLCDIEGISWRNTKVRSEVADERLKVQSAFIDVLGLFKIPYTFLHGTLEQRLEKIEQENDFLASKNTT